MDTGHHWKDMARRGEGVMLILADKCEVEVLPKA